MGVEKGQKPSKILTMSGVPSSAEKRQNCDILQCLYIKTEWGWNSRLPWFPGTFAAETGRKPRKRGGKGAKMRQKHRTSWPQTSVLSRQNLGCLPSRSPMFPNFRAEIVGKPYKCASETLMLHFCDISERGWCRWLPRPFTGHYLPPFGLMETGRGMRLRKIAHSWFFPCLRGHFALTASPLP